MMTLSTSNSLNAAAATANAGSKIKAPTGLKTTADAANDLELLRRSLIEQSGSGGQHALMNYYGMSYGTALGVSYSTFLYISQYTAKYSIHNSPPVSPLRLYTPTCIPPT